MLTSSPPERRRKLHRGHFAFMRAVVQGLPLRESWDRYVRIEGEHTDVRNVRSTIAWIRGEFAAAARREKRHGKARLVLIDADTLPDASTGLPTLDEFVKTRSLEDFSEREQIDAYTSEYGSQSRKDSRRTRLIRRQLEALQWLESLVAEPPRAGDAIGAWLHPQLAERMEAAGLDTLDDLVTLIRGVGHGWARRIPGIGATKAQRVVDWLRDHEASIGHELGDHVDIRRSQLSREALASVVGPAPSIRPLEKFRPPAELDGSAGTFRGPVEKCLLDASNDYEAILVWLRSKGGKAARRARSSATRRETPDMRASAALSEAWMQNLSHTQRAYRKEAERFLLWAILNRRKALSSMALEDCVAYRDFLADPQPSGQWCGHRAHARWSPLWRPFEGPLSLAAQRQTVVVLRNLYGFLANQGYLIGNPWSGVSVPSSPTPTINAGRSFSEKQWRFIDAQLDALPENAQSVRLRVSLRLLYSTGLRLSEVVAATADDLQWVEFPAESGEDPVEGWFLKVIGKGQRLREIPVPREVVALIEHYFALRGLGGQILSPRNRGAFILGKSYDWGVRFPHLASGRAPMTSAEGITASTLARQLKTFFHQCGLRLREMGDVRGADRFEQASTHWLRHTHASHAIAQGMPIEVAQQNLGHASLATTTIYVTTEKRRRMIASMKIFDKQELAKK